MRGTSRTRDSKAWRTLGAGAIAALALGGCLGEIFGGDGNGELDPSVTITYPTEGSEALNPITFEFEAEDVETVAFTWAGRSLQDAPIPAQQGSHTYRFLLVNAERTVLLTGYDADGLPVAEDELTFTPISEHCAVSTQLGFGGYTMAAVNEWSRYPRDQTYPYCWEELGDVCGSKWGQIHDGYYGDQLLFDGGEDCFCSGHTLEIFLRAYQLFLGDWGLSEDALFEHENDVLTLDSVRSGDFYQYWQGYGVATSASSADAFESAGIGENILAENWDTVLPGDYVNLSRSDGTGHAVIFVNWIEEGGETVGLRYYSCNVSGDSCPDPDDARNTSGISGPSYRTEQLAGHGGIVLPRFLFIGRVYMPTNG